MTDISVQSTVFGVADTNHDTSETFKCNRSNPEVGMGTGGIKTTESELY